MVQYWDLKTRQ